MLLVDCVLKGVLVHMKNTKNSVASVLDPMADGFFIYHRQAGMGLSATLIVLASALLAWVYNSRYDLSSSAKVFFWISITMFAAVILFSLFVQYFNYKGYFYCTRILMKKPLSDKPGWQYFNVADWSVDLAMVSFGVGVISSLIFWRLDIR